MDHDKLNRRLQVAANLGIVAGLVLVGVQLKQNSDLLKMQMLYEESRRSIDIETLVTGEDAAQVWAKSLTETASMTLAEQRVMEALLWSYVENLRGTHMLSQMGLLREDEWKLRVEADSAFYLANPYGRAWWANYSEDNDLPEALMAAIDARMNAVNGDFTSAYMAAIRAKLAQQRAEDAKDGVPGELADPESPESRIRAARMRYNSALATQQIEGLDGLFAPDYQLISGRGDRRQGPEAHLEMWRNTFVADPTFNCQRTPDEINVNADWGLAREVGHWLCTQTVERMPARYAGVYAAKWQVSESSAWVLQSEVFTTMSCEGPAAACRRPDPIP